MNRYDAVIHVRTPTIDRGYNHGNPLRIESAGVAADVDERLLRIWEAHPHRFIVPSSQDFLEKASRVVDILKAEIPECCRTPRRRKPAILIVRNGTSRYARCQGIGPANCAIQNSYLATDGDILGLDLPASAAG
jgi:hypothetical protein